MIRYTLTCDAGHSFESWFQSGATYTAVHAAGQVTCPICGTAKVDKDLMAPAVRPARTSAGKSDTLSDPARAVPTAKGPLSAPGSAVEAAMTALKAQIEANSEYVGVNFVTEARKMHAGDAPERAIYGEAKPDEARQMIEDGLPVAPLPFVPGRKVN